MQDIRRAQRIPVAKITRTARGVYRFFLLATQKTTAGLLAIVLILSNAQAFVAFEAHVINVTAELIQIDPPVITPPGGTGFTDPFDIFIDDSDPDATHIFYTITPGVDPLVAADPVCGGPYGGAKPLGPIELTEDSIVKAIACDGPTGSAHFSLITTEIYDFVQPFGLIRGRKCFDLNQDGICNDEDFGISGWNITATGTSTATSTVTNANGYYTFGHLLPGPYTVAEESREGWIHVTPDSVDVVIDGNEEETVNFFNNDTGYSCVPRDINFPANLAVQAAGLTSENNDDIHLGSNVTINGDARSNDDIERLTNASNVVINGSATSTDQVDDGITVIEDILEGAPTATLPDAMIPEWILRAQDGGTVNGSFIFPNNTVGLSMGPTEIMGNVTFGSSNSVTVKGPIYIHGNLTIGSNSIINQDILFGNQFVPIVVDGIIDISSNITFNGSGSTGAFLLISTHAAVAGDDAAIVTSSNNSDLGDVVLYASNGDIHIRSNRTLLAVFATHGTNPDTDDNAAVRLDSNVTVNYRTLPNKISCGARQPYESTSHVLINEFMPNPVGDDVGVAGGALDGEWVELFNPTGSSVDVNGWVLYDSDNTHALAISSLNTNTGGTVIPSLGHLVVYRDGDADFALNNSGGDTVRLFNGAIGGIGVIQIDGHIYGISAAENKSFARIPDGAPNWIDPDATPGEANLFFFEPIDATSLEDPFDPADLPLLEIPVVEEPIVTFQAEGVVAGESVGPTSDEKGKVEEPVVTELPAEPENIDGGGDSGTGGDGIIQDDPGTEQSVESPTTEQNVDTTTIEQSVEEPPTTEQSVETATEEVQATEPVSDVQVAADASGGDVPPADTTADTIVESGTIATGETQ